MVLAGMTPMQVIVAATRNAAEFLRIADAGTLQAGKSADFIVLYVRGPQITCDSRWRPS
jgi:imidazolonepropionase-like amidohydrolase